MKIQWEAGELPFLRLRRIRKLIRLQGLPHRSRNYAKEALNQILISWILNIVSKDLIIQQGCYSIVESFGMLLPINEITTASYVKLLKRLLLHGTKYNFLVKNFHEKSSKSKNMKQSYQRYIKNVSFILHLYVHYWGYLVFF